jgi:hypothetical protein
VTNRTGRIAAIAALRRAVRQSRFVRSAVARCAGAADFAFALLIVVAGLLAWSPRGGAAAMREIIAARRERRLQIGEIRRSQGEVWARHARRDPGIRLGKLLRLAKGLPLDP